jgi:hypothetical protein
MMRRLFEHLEALFMAVTFAEAGDHQTAQHYARSSAKKASTAKLPRKRVRRASAH